MSSDIAKLSRVINIFRECGGTAFPASYAVAFLTISAKPGKSVSDYAKLLGMGQPQMSRMLLELGEKSRSGGAGLGWLRREPDAQDLRVKRVMLTPHGEIMLQRIEAAMR